MDADFAQGLDIGSGTNFYSFEFYGPDKANFQSS